MINAETLIGTVIDNRYRLTREIGKGAFGWVFEATEEMAGQYVGQVAVKLLAPEDDTQRDMVLREIRALAALTHEHIISYRTSGHIHDGALAGTIFLVTELGEIPLSRLIQSNRTIPEDQAWTMAQGIALALAHIHAKGSVHRDVKPENVLRVGERWKLGDFGLVRVVEGSRLYASGAKGTLRYMAPEVLNNEIKAATDVYALGVTLLRCLTGRHAHEGENDAQFMLHLMTMPAFLPPDLPQAWRTILAGCLEKEPQKRWTAERLAQRLASGPGLGGERAAAEDVKAMKQERPELREEAAPSAEGDGNPFEKRRGASPAAAAGKSGQNEDQERTVALEQPVPEGEPTRRDPLRDVKWLEPEPVMSVSTELRARHIDPSAELKLCGPSERQEPETDGQEEEQDSGAEAAEIPTADEEEVWTPPTRSTKSKSNKLVVVVVVLAIMAGGYVLSDGNIRDIVQRVGQSGGGALTTEAPSEPVELTVLSEDPAIIRSAPRPEALSLGILSQHARVLTLGRSGEWYKIQVRTGGEAWVHQSAFLDSGPTPEAR